jgi:predicted small lipoprotein YifL
MSRQPRIVAVAILTLMLALSLAACGKKGLPVPPPDQPQTYPKVYPRDYDPLPDPKTQRQ